MKPIDEQNAVLLALHCADGTPEKIIADLRAGGVSMTLHQVRRALGRLEADGMVRSVGDLHVMGKAESPFYELTDAGRAEAAQLPEGK